MTTLLAILAAIASIWLAGIPIAWLLIPGDGNVIDQLGRIVYAVVWPVSLVADLVAWKEDRASTKASESLMRAYRAANMESEKS